MHNGEMGQGRPESVNDPLRAVLRKWADIEPSPHFRQAVWQRIHAAPGTTFDVSPVGLVRSRFPAQWGWASAAAVAAAVVIGSLAGVIASVRDMRSAASEPLLHTRTIAGAYFFAATGVRR